MKQGGALLGTVAMGVSQKLEETGMNQKMSAFVSTATEKSSAFVNTAAEASLKVSTKIYQTSADTLSTLAQNPAVHEITEKSKVALSLAGDKLAETSNVIHLKKP